MRLFTVLLFALALITTHAHANTATAPSRSVLDKVADALKNPSKARKIFNPTGIAAQLAFDKLLEGIDYVMNEGAEAQQKDKEANKREYYSNAQSSYPYEYYGDGTVFSSPEAIHAHIVSDAFLAKQGYKRTRRSDGLYYDKMIVDYSSMTVTHIVQAGTLSWDYPNNVGGGLQYFYTKIYFVGTLSDKEVQRNDEQAEKERKRKIIERLARQYEADLAEAEANNPPSDKEKEKEKEQDETKDKPKTGTQTGAGAGTADNTATNTKDETTAQSGTGTKKDDKDNKEKDKKEKDFEMPDFCDWATWFCDDDTQPEQDTQLDIKDKDIDLDGIAQRNYINFTSQCPANYVYSMPIMGKDVVIEFRLDILCRLFILMKPFTLIFAYIQALIIVGRDL